MAMFTNLNELADHAGFIVVYPNGTGALEVLRGWNAGAFLGDSAKESPDDVSFLGKVLDQVEATLAVDKKRVYVTGMSNGAMMAYRLAGALSRRIAAVAAVAGTLALDDCVPERAVPVLHFHGTADPLVPFSGPKGDLADFVKFKSVQDTISIWVKRNECHAQPVVSELPALRDRHKVTRQCYNHGRDNAEVVLYVIDGGGHAWPGMHYQPDFLGPSTDNINANEMMWGFFQRHALP
jgi:polyhydroxybutyrate depolymerase